MIIKTFIGQILGFIAAIVAFALMVAILYPIMVLSLLYGKVFKAWYPIFNAPTLNKWVAAARNPLAEIIGEQNAEKIFAAAKQTLNQVSTTRLVISAIIQTVIAPFTALISAIPFAAVTAFASSIYVYYKITTATNFTPQVQSNVNHATHTRRPYVLPVNNTTRYSEIKSPTMLNANKLLNDHSQLIDSSKDCNFNDGIVAYSRSPSPTIEFEI